MLTASTIVVDEPTTFYFDQPAPYQPSNFEKKFYGTVTLRDALAHSLNVATVKVGQMVGFDTVVDDGQPRGHELQDPADSGGGARAPTRSLRSRPSAPTRFSPTAATT